MSKNQGSVTEPAIGNGKFTPEAIASTVKTTDPLYQVFLADSLITEGVENNRIAVSVPSDENAPYKCHLLRNANGLLNGVEYKYNKYGKIDWEAMFNPELYVYPNNDPSKKPLLKTDGLLDLADIRGVESKEVEVRPVSESMVTVWVKMKFIPNVENPNGLVWAGSADATPANVGGKGYSKYLTPIAETRAVGRCIRGALNIRLCTFEEVCKDDIEDESDNKRISDEVIVAIERQMKVKGINQENIMVKIHEKYPNISSLNQLSVTQGRALLSWANSQRNVETKIKE